MIFTARKLALYLSMDDLQDGKSTFLAIPGYAECDLVEIVSGAAHFFVHVKPSQGTEEEAIFGLGDNRFFQQGHARPTSWETLHKIDFFDASMPFITKVACGNLHTAFLCADGALYLSGDDSKGQCGGFSEQEPSLVEFPLLANHASDIDVLDVACGSNHTVVLTSEGVFVTGSSTYHHLSNTDSTLNAFTDNAGQLGLGHLADSPTFVEQPRSVSEMTYKEAFAAGWNTVLLASG
jgi:alpha-tubulin suppressor-like RCC1 family protein